MKHHDFQATVRRLGGLHLPMRAPSRLPTLRWPQIDHQSYLDRLATLFGGQRHPL